jgi:hypothetical protein
VVRLKTRRIVKGRDLPTIYSWYAGHGWNEQLPEKMLPTRGYIVDDLAALWLYVADDKSIGWIGHMVINPKKGAPLAFKALHLLYERVEAEASKLGLGMLTQTVHHSSLKKLAKQHNYVEGDVGLTSYWKKV